MLKIFDYCFKAFFPEINCFYGDKVCLSARQWFLLWRISQQISIQFWYRIICRVCQASWNFVTIDSKGSHSSSRSKHIYSLLLIVHDHSGPDSLHKTATYFLQTMWFSWKQAHESHVTINVAISILLQFLHLLSNFAYNSIVTEMFNPLTPE
jgi:hypothetical protein